MTDWSELYRIDDVTWDVGGPHPELARRFKPLAGESTALVAGCGLGHDAVFLAESGLKVLGLDLVEQLQSSAGDRLRAAGSSFQVCNALEWEPETQFDLVFEHTFLCALEPEMRPKWAALIRRSVRPGGRFVAVAFPGGKSVELGGPPFGYSVEDMGQLLGDEFELRVDEPVQAGVGRREWEERWVEFVRVG